MMKTQIMGIFQNRQKLEQKQDLGSFNEVNVNDVPAVSLIDFKTNYQMKI